MNLTQSLIGIEIPDTVTEGSLVKSALTMAKEKGFVESGQKAVVIKCENEEKSDESNVMEIVNVD